MNIENFPNFPIDDNSIVEFKTKQRHEWENGSLKMMGKSSFLLKQKQYNITMILYLPCGTILFQCIIGSNV